MELAEACARAKRGNCVLFIGSGFGFHGTNADGETLPTGSDLAKLLSDKLGEPQPLSLGRAADIAADELPSDELDHFLRRKLTPTGIDPALKDLVQIPWVRVYSTNYDNLFELAAVDAGVKSDALLPSSPVATANNQTDVVHLHGAIPRQGRVIDAVVLGDESYLHSQFISSAWYHVFLNDVASASAVIFLGYSLSDLDLGRIIVSRPELIEKTCIVTGPIDERERRRLAKFGSVYDGGYAGLHEELLAAPDSEAAQASPFVALHRVSLPELVGPANSGDAFDLYGLGILHPGAYISQLRDGSPYSVQRTAFDRIISGYEAGVTRVLLHSHFGNGKSVFIEQLALGLAEQGFDVYMVGANSFNLDEELARVRNAHGRRAVLFDNALRHRNAFIAACTQMPPEVAVIGSTRTLTFNTEYQRLFTLIPGLTEYELNELRTPELQNLSENLSYFGLWGSEERKNAEQKLAVLRGACRSEISSTVLHLLESSSIADRIQQWVRDLAATDERLVRVVAAALVLAKANLVIPIEEVVHLSNIEISWFQREVRGSTVGEVLNLSGPSGQARSPVLAEYLLKKAFSTDIVTMALWSLLKNFHDHQELSEYQYFARQLLRLSFLATLFGNDRKSDLIVAFYDNVRTLSTFRSDPQFWVQFAMIRAERSEWRLAETYFANAYSYASKGFSNYRTFMIDDQYARFLLLSRADAYRPEDAYASFLRASRIVQNALRDDLSDVYPFRTAAHVQPFAAVFADTLGIAERQTIIEFCENIMKLIDRADTRVNRFGEMRDCRAAMEGAVQYLSKTH